ncbi:NmrA family NAD(P)-binding protein [Companilactobacillus sp. DQM5]|uniref:NmrA family NAD(P)-binding protein n=1 Tax=Companilactobacillus sp. DQM5 TaxID=3463359 RepID=UPI004059EB81
MEKYIEETGISYCHIRPSFFMQNISGIHAFEIKYFNKIVVPVVKALTSFIDAEDIGEITAEILCNPDKHKNKAYSITGPEAIDYWKVAKILTNELGRKIEYSNLKPLFAKKYWISVRGLDKGYITVMSLLYMMTRLGTAKQVTSTFEEIMEKIAVFC